MAVDTPARIAVLGAGPIGLEAALYARFLGYDVDVYERTTLAAHVLRWGHARMFSPFGLNRSTLGLAALAAHDEHYHRPDDDALLTGREFVEGYLRPLSRTDLLAEHIQENQAVRAVERVDAPSEDPASDGDPDASPLQLRLLDVQGRERVAWADVVLDATGALDHPIWLGPGGEPCAGEWELRERIEYGLPDVLGAEREHYVGRRTLIVGDGYIAASSVTALAELARVTPEVEVVWITSPAPRGDDSGPVEEIPGDPFPGRLETIRAANQLSRGASPQVTHWPGATVASMTWDPEGGRFAVAAAGAQQGIHAFDRIVANVGYRRDSGRDKGQRIGQPAPLPNAADPERGVERRRSTHDRPGPQVLGVGATGFYVLGAKSCEDPAGFLMSTGFEQIRSLFSIIGGRQNLDLYESVAGLLE